MELGDSSFLRTTITKYLEKRNFTSIVTLGRGGFGDVLSAVTPKKESVAIKIIRNTLSWQMEEKTWPLLLHPNILPLYDVIDLKEMNAKLYIMPRHPTSLHKMVRGRKFLLDPNGLNRIRRWLRNSAEGLEYLHNAGFVHLDIKSDNVLITHQDTAVLCDFSGINLKKLPCRRLVAPYVYRPPECFIISEKHRVDGAAFDIWTYALMSFNVLTGNWPDNNFSALNVYFYATWKKKIERVLKISLEKEKFYTIMRCSLPEVPILNEDLQLAYDFVLQMIKWNPKHRPSAHQILEHPFLSIKNSPQEISLPEERNENKMKVNNPFFANTTDENTLNPTVSLKHGMANSSHLVSKEKEVFGTKRSRLKELPNVNSSTNLQVLNQSSSEKQDVDNAPDKKAFSKKKKNFVRRIKNWITKKCNRALKSAKRNCIIFTDIMMQEHWTEHWTLCPL